MRDCRNKLTGSFGSQLDRRSAGLLRRQDAADHRRARGGRHCRHHGAAVPHPPAPAHSGQSRDRNPEHAKRPGVGATNFVYEKAEPDGMTILFNSWDPLAQALGDQGMRARYENFEFLGGIGDYRVIYGRSDMIPGGIKKAADIMKADNVILGSLNYTNQSGLLPHLALNVLGVKHRMIVGFRGGAGVFLAMQRGEVQMHSTS